MTTVQIIRQYIWIVNTLMSNGRMTLEELSRKWQDDEEGRSATKETLATRSALPLATERTQERDARRTTARASPSRANPFGNKILTQRTRAFTAT